MENKADVNAELKSARYYMAIYKGAVTSMDIALYKKDTHMQELLSDFGGKTSSKKRKLRALKEYGNDKEIIDVIKSIL